MNREFGEFRYGKYKGELYLNIWKGSYDKIDSQLIANYINECVDFFFGILDSKKMILSNGYVLNPEEVKLLHTLRELPGLRPFIKINENLISVNTLDLTINSRITSLLLNFFNYSHFRTAKFDALLSPSNDSDIVNLAINSQMLAGTIPDPKYLRWSKRNIPNFDLTVVEKQIMMYSGCQYPSIILKQHKNNTISFKFLAFINFMDIDFIYS